MKATAEGNGATPADVVSGRAEWCAVNGDGFALARALGSKAVDHVIADPPYDAKTHAGARTLAKDSRGAIRSAGRIAIDFATLPPVSTFAPDLITVACRWVICFCALEQLGAYRDGVPAEHWIRSGIWVRTDSTPQVSGDRPAQGAEGIAIMHREGAKRWNGGGNRGVWTGGICREASRVHETKKPLWLMEALIRDFTDPGDIILDPTMGEGTTGEACLRLGRRFIGAELATGVDPATGAYDPAKDYYSAAVRRLTRAASQPRQAMLLGTDAGPRPKPAKGAGKTVEMWPAAGRASREGG